MKASLPLLTTLVGLFASSSFCFAQIKIECQVDGTNSTFAISTKKQVFEGVSGPGNWIYKENGRRADGLVTAIQEPNGRLTLELGGDDKYIEIENIDAASGETRAGMHGGGVFVNGANCSISK